MVINLHWIVVFTYFLCIFQLFHPYWVSRLFICFQYFLNNQCSLINLLFSVTQYQNMLILHIIWLWWISFFMRILSSYQYLAPCLLLKLLLVSAFWANQQSYIVNACYLWKVNLCPVLKHLRVCEHVGLVEQALNELVIIGIRLTLLDMDAFLNCLS
jgi:hypothetical protein